jgi:hypothetical protein
LCDENSIIKACEGANFIIHTASPISGKQPSDFLDPAVGGTKAVMKAA